MRANNVKISQTRVFEFGKYKGYSVSYVIKHDPQYIEFMHSKVSWLFTPHEMQSIKNQQARLMNKDIYKVNVRTRSNLEEEMYELYRKNFI